MSESFDDIAKNASEVIDDLLRCERDQARRLELIARSVRRAMSIAYKAAKSTKRAIDESRSGA